MREAVARRRKEGREVSGEGRREGWRRNEGEEGGGGVVKRRGGLPRGGRGECRGRENHEKRGGVELQRGGGMECKGRKGALSIRMHML